MNIYTTPALDLMSCLQAQGTRVCNKALNSRREQSICAMKIKMFFHYIFWRLLCGLRYDHVYFREKHFLGKLWLLLDLRAELGLRLTKLFFYFYQVRLKIFKTHLIRISILHLNRKNFPSLHTIA